MSLEYIETGTFATKASRTTSETFRILSWNINRGYRFDQIVDFLASSDADLILLQECDRNAARSSFRNIAREIAQRLEMNYVFGVEFIELSQGRSALHGQATLARTQLSNPRVLRFEHQSTFWKPRWFLPNIPRLQRRLGGRIVLVCETTVYQSAWTVYNLHLESRCGDDLRYAQLLEVLDDASGCCPNNSVVIAGDFNCDISQRPFASVIHERQLQNAFVGDAYHPTVLPRSRRRSRVIDGILHRRAAIGRSPIVHASVGGSDHFPLSLDIHIA